MSLSIPKATVDQWRQQRMSVIMITDFNAKRIWQDVLGHIKSPQDQIMVISPFFTINQSKIPEVPIPEVVVYQSLHVLEEEVCCRQRNLQHYSHFPHIFAVVDSSIFVSPKSHSSIERHINMGLIGSVCHTLFYHGRHLSITLVLLDDRAVILPPGLRKNIDLHFFTTNSFQSQGWWETMISPYHQESFRKLPRDMIYVNWMGSAPDPQLQIVEPCKLVNDGPFWDLATKMSSSITCNSNNNNNTTDDIKAKRPLTLFEQSKATQIYLTKTIKMMNSSKPILDMKMIYVSQVFIPFFMRIPKTQSLSSEVEDSLLVSSSPSCK
jgi:hypothetical protein